LTAAAGAAGALIVVGALAGGYEIGHGRVATRTVTVTVTRTATVTPSAAAEAEHRRTAAAARSSAAAALPLAVLHSCEGQAVTRPVDYTLTCADGGETLAGLSWTNWGGPQATATGQLATNDCTPDCAEGTFHYAPVRVIASGLQDGTYLRLDITGDCTYGCSWTIGPQGPSA
jgi:hypothetical protein